MGLLERIAEARPQVQRSFSWPYESPFGAESYMFGGQQYFGVASSSGIRDREVPQYGFLQLVNAAFRSNAIIFACELKRISVFSEARFKWCRYRDRGLWSNPDLAIFDTPWPRATTSDLLAEILIMADMGGNGFITRSTSGPDRLRVLRPDWCTIVMGDSSGRPVETAGQLDAEVIGLIYDPHDGLTEPEALTVDEFAHFIPPGLRDPLARFRGMSWLTPVLRELQADQAATMHKLAFFEQGATPQLVVKFQADITEEQFEGFVRKMDSTHNGWRNAYKTLYLGGGADVTPVGADLKQLDFANTQGKGETRIAAASGIHPVLVPLSEGMQGSSLNAGNYAAARRSTADMVFRPLWRNVAGSLAAIVPPPGGNELWYDEASIPFLREDGRDAAEIEQVKAATIVSLVNGGFTPASAMAAVDAQDVKLLVHSGLVSVQLQPPGIREPDVSTELPSTKLPALTAPTNGKG